MRRRNIVLAAIMLCGSAQGTQAAALTFAKPITVHYYPGLRDATDMRAQFSPNAATITPQQVSACANFAALRALGARAAGVDRANQSRLADLTFVLCLTDSPGAG